MKKDAEFAKLTGEVSQLERQINNAHGFKIASDDFTASDVEAIDNFIKWAKDNLPSYIQIGDIKDVADRLKVKGMPIGLFAMHLNNISGGVDVGGTMYVGEKGYRYHEAFHAVFRLLLSDVEITKYLTIAKKEVRVKLKNEGKNFRLELEKFRNKSESYASMSEARLEQEYLEEYLADEFEKFKANPKSSNTSGVIKSLFNRLVEWIKSVFNRYDKNELRNLFEKMDAGKYKSAGSIENRFTQSFKTGVTVEAYKLLPYEKIKLDRGYANKYLDPSTTDLLIRQITSSYLDRAKRILPGQSREAILIETIQDFQAYHDPFDKRNAGRSGAEITELINRFKALGGVLDGSNSEEIEHAVDFMGKTMDVVLEYISLFDQKIQNEKYLTDQFEENEGLRNVADWDKDQSMIGGFSSLPMALRAYIGTTTLLSSENTFGDVLPSGLRLHVPVDFITAYNGLLKAVKNNTDEVKFLRSLISFSKGNLQTKSVVERMLNDIGVDEEIILNSKRGDIMKSIKNTSFFMEIFKGFENFKLDYLFVHTNTNSNATESNSKVLLYDAANRDDTNTQIDVWKQSYSELYNQIKGNPKLLNKATDSLIALSGFLDNIGDKMSDKKIDSKAQELSDGIYNSLGIRLSPAYVSFSIISNLTNISGSNYQQSILNNNKQAEPISSEALVEIVNQIKVSEGSNRMAGYLFSKKGTGVRGRLQKLAKSNAMFDELIGQTVFLNPEGNFVYAHQMGTLHLKKIYGLNDASNLDVAKKKDNGYNVTNVLLNSPAFLAMAEQDQLKILRVAGVKESSLNETNESVLDENSGIALDKNGKTYGSLTRSEFTAMSINAYLANYQQLSQQNKKIEFVDPDTGEILDTALAPVLIRVLEASNTGDMMSLPIIRTVELDEKGSVKLTTEAIDLFTEEINREFQRIQREAATPRDQRTPIDGYNAVDGNLTFGNKGRAFEFSDSGYLLASQNNSSNQLEAKDPRLSDAIAYRVVKGTQKFAYVSKKAGMSIGLTREGTTSRSPVKIKSGKSSKSFGLKALGLVQVNENNIKGIIESMGEGISKTKTKNFIYAVQVGDATFYVENKVTRDFLNGDVKRYGYELTDASTKQTSAQQTSKVLKTPSELGISNTPLLHGTTYKIDKIDPLFRQKNKAKGNKTKDTTSGSSQSGTGIYLSPQLGFDPNNPTFTTGGKLIKTEVGENAMKWTTANKPENEFTGYIYEIKLKPDAKILDDDGNGVILDNKGKRIDYGIRNITKEAYEKLRAVGVDAIYSKGETVLINENAVEELILDYKTPQSFEVVEFDDFSGKPINPKSFETNEEAQKYLKEQVGNNPTQSINRSDKSITNMLGNGKALGFKATKGNLEKQDRIQPTPQTSEPINIYAGTNENAELSNFAHRPFSTEVFDENNNEIIIQFNNVEAAFQAMKAITYASDATDKEDPENAKIVEKLKTATGSQAKKLGRQVKGLYLKDWNDDSESVMKDLIRESFEQNPDALKALLATGNSTLTHTQDKTKYRELFPKILMEVREELGGSQSTKQTSGVEKVLVDKSTLKDGDVVYDKDNTKFIFRGLRKKGTTGAGSPRLERTDNSGEIAIPGVNIKLYAQSTIQTSDVEMFNGLPVINSNEIVNSEGKEGAARFDKGQILVNRKLLKTKFGKKAWTKPRELKDGSRAKNLPEDQFKTYEEFEEFVLAHEYVHSIYTRKEFIENVNGSTKGDYETEINRRALENIESLKALEAAEEAMVEAMIAKSEMNEALDLKTLLETIAKEDPNVTLEQALKDDRINMSMSQFKSTLERRLIDDYMNFALDLESGRIEQKLSSDIINGFADDSGVENGDAAMTELNLIRNNQDYNLMQIYFNNWLNTKAINQLIYGDQAKSLKNAIDKIKRAKLSNASYISAGSSLFDKSKGVNHKTKDILGVLFTDPTFDKTYDDGRGERADAQMYITTKALRHMLFGFGTLDDAKVDLLNKIEKGEYIDADLFWGYIDNNKNRIEGYKSLGAIFNSLKLVYADGDTALKMSAVVLTPELTSRITGRDTDGNPIYEAKEQARPLHNLRLKLEKLQVENPKAIAIAYPQSASKMMKKNAISQEDVFGDNLFADIKPSLLDADYMGLQMINPSNKTEITDPTQLKALITSELNDKEIVYINGEKFDLGTLRKRYNLLSKTKLNNKYFNKVNLIANFSIEGAMRELRTSKKTGELTIELDEFKDFAVESLKASGAASNTIEFFVKDLNYDLNNSLVQRQFEQLFLAYFTKGTISEKISGDALALMSDHGMRVVRRVFSVDENGVPDKFSVIRDVIYNRNPLPIELRSDDNGNLEGLASLLEASNGEGIIISDVLRHNVKEYDKSGNYTGVRYTEGLRAANSAEASIIEEGSMSMEDVISKAFAVRIPSQDKHSASSVKFIDFLPVYYGSTAIFSKELIEISGADFDIDKVYVHTKEFYKDSVTGKLIEYGINGRSGKEKGFDDYIHYINEKVKSKKSSYSKASEKYDRSTLNDKQKYTNAELVKAKKNKLSKESFRALKLLGLPITLSEYVEHVKVKGEPYDAALANQLLDYKFAMWGNESNTVKSKEGKNPIAYDAADIKALTDVWDYIKENLPGLAEEVDGNMGDVDSLYGQGKAFGNNKEGAASIGKIVLPNLFLNLLGEHNITIRDIKIAGVETLPQIKFNGIKFNEFNAQYEKIKVNGEITAGQRTQYIISALITAMTDNAKERLAWKLGLNKDALNLVGMYSKLGVPIRTSILLVSNPIIKDEYFAANNKISKTDPGIASRIKSLVRELEFDNKGIKQNQKEVTDEMLQRHINNDINLNNANQKEVFEIYSILKQFQTGHGIKSHINELSSVMNLSKGFGQNFSDIDRTNNSLKKLGIEMSDEEFKKTSFPVDVRSLFKSDLWQSNLVDVFKHFKDVLLPQVFLTRTPGFVQMQEVVLENLKKDEYLMDEDVKYQISNDLLSFLTIKAYMKDLESKGAMTSLASLNNEILYPQSNSEFNIHSLITSLRKQYPDNYFLNVLIYNERADDLDNVTGMHNAVSNTFGKKKDIDKIRAQAAFMEIFGENKIDAMHLIHYMMVKDGFQYSSGSLIEAVTPAVLDNFSTSIENVFGIMKAERHGEIFKKKFGNTYNGLINEFVYGYSKSNRNNVYLNTIYDTPFYSALYRETSLSNVKITKELVASNPNKIYVFAENQNQVGTTGDAVIRGLENARPLTLMYDLATYYDAVDLSDFANRLDFEISEILNSGKEIILPEFLLSKNKMKKLKAESPDVFDYLDEKLRSEFGYILTDNGSGYVTLEEGSVKKLSSIESKPAYIVKETNETILHVNLKNDLGGSLSKYGFTLKTETIKGKKVKTLNLPAVVKNVVYDKNENGFVTSTRAETFELIEVTNPYKKESEYLLDADNPIASGVSAKYRLTESKGSNYQHQNGFMFDTVSFERPSYKEVREYVSDDARGLVDDSFDNEDVGVSSYIDNKVRVEEAGFEIEIESGSAYAYVERGRVLISELVDSDFTSEAVESVVEETDEIIDQNETDYTEDVDQNAGDAFDVNDIFGTLEETLEEKYPRIVKWWDNNIQNNPENLSKLAAEEQIANLEQLLKQRDDPEQSYETDVEFIDHLKSCIL